MGDRRQVSLQRAVEAAPLMVWTVRFDRSTSAAPEVLAGAAHFAQFLQDVPQAADAAKWVQAGRPHHETRHSLHAAYHTHYAPVFTGEQVTACSVVTTILPVPAHVGRADKAAPQWPAEGAVQAQACVVPPRGSPAAAASLEQRQRNCSMWFDPSIDVDQHKRDRLELEEILENMNEAFFAVDKNWIIRRINKQQEISSKIKRQDQLGKNFLDLFLSTPQARRSSYWEKYQQAMKSRVGSYFEAYYPPLALWTAVNVYPSADGGLAVILRDITAERRLRHAIEVEKQKLEAIFVDAPACMALLQGDNFIFEKVNPSYAALMGNRPLVGKSLEEALPELSGQIFKDLMTKVYYSGVTHYGSEQLVRLIRRPGGEVENTYVDFSYSRVIDGTGKPYGIYIHAIDITDRYIAKKETLKLTENLQDAIRARDDFLSSASHELKTPLTSLKMQLQMTRRGVKPEHDMAPTPSRLAKTLDLSCRQVERLTALIDDLLDVSRIESGKMSFEFEQTDLVALLFEVTEQFKEQFQAAGCTVETLFAGQVIVSCDCFRIEQVMTNLISNAVKYGAGSHIHIAVQTSPHGGARITVADGGMGIASDKQGLVFDRFERAISHNNVSGLGLGLYICKQIINAHHGTISLASELGKGSVFTVDLPGAPGLRLADNSSAGIATTVQAG